jgi:hypothetical protein
VGPEDDTENVISAYRILVGHPDGKSHLGGLDIEVMITLGLILKKRGIRLSIG